MISKLATWGATRDEAIARMRRALGEYLVGGIRTTIPFFLSVLADAEFCQGEIDTGFIARFLARQPKPDAVAEQLTDEQLAALLVAAQHYAQQARQQQSSNNDAAPAENKWKLAGRLAALHSR
jgi:acetyl-CoA carboxylase biotin carboxylase subunit